MTPSDLIENVMPLDGKKPILKDWPNRELNTNQKQAKKWLEKGNNLGYRIRPDHLVVDIDPRHGATKEVMEQLANFLGYDTFIQLKKQTLSVKTGGGGHHIYFKLKANTNPNALVQSHNDFPGIDFKTHKTQVVIPPSIHPDTKEKYKWINRHKKIKKLPICLYSLLKRTKRKNNCKGEEWAADKLKQALGYLNSKNYNSNERFFRIMASAHHVTKGTPEALDAFTEWARLDPNYDSDDNENSIRNRWNSLDSNREDAITLGTLERELRLKGYRGNALSAQEEFSCYFDKVPTIIYNNANPLESVEETIEALDGLPIYSRARDLVTVENGNIRVLDKYGLRNILNKHIQYVKNLGSGSKPCDVPHELSDRIRASVYRFPQLRTIVRNPLVSPDRKLLDQPGYHKKTGLYFELTDTLELVNHSPTIKELHRAVKTIFKPFQHFPLSTSTDWGVLLSLLLSAWLRPVLPTCPTFGIDAPDQGTGKTLLSKCAAAIGGEKAPIQSPMPARREEEVAKITLATLLKGKSVAVYDNQLGTFDSASFAAAITSETYEGRKLGESEIAKVPNATLFIFTGNNLRFKGDMIRRVYVCRIDANSANPSSRKFPFDPLKIVNEQRQKIINAMATIVFAQLNDSEFKRKVTTGSFEVWDELVRQTVLWVKEKDLYKLEDPALAIQNSNDNDPTRLADGRVLSCLYSEFGQNRFTASDALNKLRKDICEAWPYVEEFKARSLTTAFSHLRDRIIDELKLVDAGTNREKTKMFKIQRCR